MTKIKVLLICHFSNPEVRGKLLLSDADEYHDFAVWITNRIIGYKKSDEIELHVVAPHKGMIHRRQSFIIDGIHYNFYDRGSNSWKLIQTGLNFAVLKLRNDTLRIVFQNLRNLYLHIQHRPQKRYVRTLVKNIKPDVIHLNGAENPSYSSTVLGLDRFGIPICVTIQGTVSSPDFIKYHKGIDKFKIELEVKIHMGFKYYLVTTVDHYALVKSQNPRAVFLFNPGIRTINIDPAKESIQKTYDFVFYARIGPVKGIEHLLKAVSILKVNYPDVSLLVMGPVSNEYLEHIKELCSKYGIATNVVFKGHIPRREDLFREALRARIYVLPTLMEGLATSAVEAMLLGLAVVTYATGGMPLLNYDGQNVLMSDTGDIDGLVANMKKLLDDPDFAAALAKRGQDFANRTFAEEPNVKRNIRQYRAIIDNYHSAVPIPEDLSFDGIYSNNRIN